MLTDAQKKILTEWHAMMAEAYLYGVKTAQSKANLSPWTPPVIGPCEVCSDRDIEQYNQAARSAFEAHSQIQNEPKKPEFDAEYQNAVETGLTDGSEGKTKEYSPKAVWWDGYRANLDQAYANSYDKAQSVAGGSSKAWWLIGGLGVVAAIAGAAMIASGAKKNPSKSHWLKYEYQLRGSGAEGMTSGYGLVHHADTIAEAIESAKRNEPDFDILEVKFNKTGRTAAIYNCISPGNWKKVG